MNSINLIFKSTAYSLFLALLIISKVNAAAFNGEYSCTNEDSKVRHSLNIKDDILKKPTIYAGEVGEQLIEYKIVSVSPKQVVAIAQNNKVPDINPDRILIFTKGNYNEGEHGYALVDSYYMPPTMRQEEGQAGIGLQLRHCTKIQ